VRPFGLPPYFHLNRLWAHRPRLKSNRLQIAPEVSARFYQPTFSFSGDSVHWLLRYCTIFIPTFDFQQTRLSPPNLALSLLFSTYRLVIRSSTRSPSFRRFGAAVPTLLTAPHLGYIQFENLHPAVSPQPLLHSAYNLAPLLVPLGRA
jgi:hypothetical protein